MDDERKVRFQVLSNVLTEPLRVPLKGSTTIADASKEILDRICQLLNITSDKAKISSLYVCLANGQRNVLCARDTLNDSLDVVTETSLHAEVLMESSSSSSSAAAAAAALTKPANTEVKQEVEVEVDAYSAATAAGTQLAKKARIDAPQPSSSAAAPSAAAASAASLGSAHGEEHNELAVRTSPPLQQQQQQQQQQQPQQQQQQQQQPEAINLDDEVIRISVNVLVAQRSGLDLYQLRFIYDGSQLIGSRTVSSYGMENGDEIDVIIVQAGDIGIWRAPDSVHPFLSNISTIPSPTSPPKDADLALLVAKLTQGQREDLTGTTVLDERLERVLNPSLCEKLRLLLDQRQLAAAAITNNNNNNNNSTNNNTDYKLYLTFPELCQHIGDTAAAALSRRIHGDYTLIVLRRCEPQGQCIDFHLDNSERVLQVALNGDDKYQGGRLMFATSDGVLLTPQRGEGTATLHNRTVVHGVSKHTRGVRYGLFFLKETLQLQ